jgi:hypothetical protein
MAVDRESHRVELDRQDMLAKGLSTPNQAFEEIDAAFEKLDRWVAGATRQEKGVTENILSGVDSMRTRLNLMKANIANILGINSRS